MTMPYAVFVSLRLVVKRVEDDEDGVTSMISYDAKSTRNMVSCYVLV